MLGDSVSMKFLSVLYFQMLLCCMECPHFKATNRSATTTNIPKNKYKTKNKIFCVVVSIEYSYKYGFKSLLMIFGKNVYQCNIQRHQRCNETE